MHVLSYRLSLEYLSDLLIRDNCVDTPFIKDFLKPLTKYIGVEIKKHGPNKFIDRPGMTYIHVIREV